MTASAIEKRPFIAKEHYRRAQSVAFQRLMSLIGNREFSDSQVLTETRKYIALEGATPHDIMQKDNTQAVSLLASAYFAERNSVTEFLLKQGTLIDEAKMQPKKEGLVLLIENGSSFFDPLLAIFECLEYEK